jgi:hypothetical protein
MGLLLGASIVSVIEALDYFFFEGILSKEKKKRKESLGANVPEVSVVGRNSTDDNFLMSDIKNTKI